MLRTPNSLVRKHKYSLFRSTDSNLKLFTRARPSQTSASASASASSLGSPSAPLKDGTKTGTETGFGTASATARESTETETTGFKLDLSSAPTAPPASRENYHPESKLKFEHAYSRRTGKTPRAIAIAIAYPATAIPGSYSNPVHDGIPRLRSLDNIPEQVQEPAPSMVRRKKTAKQLNGPASKRGKEAKKRLLERIAQEERVQQLNRLEESVIPEDVQQKAAKPKFAHEELVRMAEEQRAERQRLVDRLREEIREGIAMEQGQDVRIQEEDARREEYPSQSPQMAENNAGQQIYPPQNSGYGDMTSMQYAQQPYLDPNSQVMGFGQPSYPNTPFPFMAMPIPVPMPVATPMPLQIPSSSGYWGHPQAPMFQPWLPQPSPSAQSPFPPAPENPPFLEPTRPSLRPGAPVSLPVRQKSTSARSGPAAPKLSKEYLTQASHSPTLTPTPQPLLIILDLNGTLIFRKKRKLPAVFARRPGLDAFLSYLFSNFKTMIWTSSQPETVASVVYQLFPHGEHKQLVDVWARDTLGLTKAQYREKVQVYKPLNKVWKSKHVQSSYPQSPNKPPSSKNGRWNQTNTILIDDSALKAIANPHNIIEIPEFTNDPRIDEQKNLHTVMRQLRILSHHEDVSQKLREWAQLRKQGAATVSPDAVDEFWDAQLRVEEEKLETLLGRKLDAIGTQTPGVDENDDADVEFVSLNRDRDRDASPTERAVDETQQELDRKLHISSLTPTPEGQGVMRVASTGGGGDGTQSQSQRAANNKRRKARRKESKKAKARARIAAGKDNL